MISTEKLNDIVLQVQALDDETLQELRYALRATAESEAYATWKATESEGKRCPLPAGVDERIILSRFGLSDEKTMLAKVNVNNDNYLVTDGLWTPAAKRVFPFTDESEILQQHIAKGDHIDWADIIVDPATGSGNHAVALGSKPCVACDVNLRAIAYCVLNVKLNQRKDTTVVWNDLRRGLPPVVSLFGNKKVLFVVNMPFALAPAPPPGDERVSGYLPLSSDGGTTGARMTFAALSAIADFAAARPSENTRLALLCYSMGNLEEERWQVVEHAKQLFGEERVSWSLARDRKMWRVNGVKAELNPMSLVEGLPKKADCRYYIQDKDRNEVLTGYQRLAADMNNVGWDALGYGVLEVRSAS